MIWPWLVGAWASHALAPTLYLRRQTFGDDGQPELALTFDDGPDPRYTPQVLAILAHYGVHATFFVVGRKAQRYPNLVRAIRAGGHDLGNHSYAHTPPWFQLPWGAYFDHMRTNEAVTWATGAPPVFARAPWGCPNAGKWLATVRSHQTYVHWTVHAYDWKPGVTPAEIHRRVMEQAAPGGIVLLHDGTGYPGNPGALLTALPGLIEALQEHYRLVPLRHWLPHRTQEVLPYDGDAVELGAL